MSGNGPIIVHAPTATPLSDAPVRIEETNPTAVVECVEQAEQPGSVLVAVDTAVGDDHDQLVALVSVLITAGVNHIETRSPAVVRRQFDTHLAITTGAIEVLES